MEFQGKPLTFQRLRSFQTVNVSAPFLRSEHAPTMDLGECLLGEMGTGARGAPVPVVGLYEKIKRAQAGSSGLRPNEGHVNSP